MLAPPHRRPTYIAETLDALLQPYPAVDRTDDGATCAGWTATAPKADNGSLTLAGDGQPIDGLRALAAAAWAVHDRQGALDAKQVADPLDQLAAHGLKIQITARSARAPRAEPRSRAPQVVASGPTAATPSADP